MGIISFPDKSQWIKNAACVCVCVCVCARARMRECKVSCKIVML